MRRVRNFTKKADAGWDGGLGTGSGIMAPDYMGLGFGFPGGGGSGLGNELNLPPSHQGHPGDLAAGPWSGDSNIRERFQNEFVRKEMPADWTPEDLISELKNLIKINTPESRDKALFLKHVLDDKMRRMKASRRAYDSLILTKNATLVAELKNDTFVQALFAEHNVSLEKLDEIETFPEELSHFALHNLVHFILEAQTSQQPLKGECPESEKIIYVSVADLVENNFKADCPEGDRRLEHMKPVTIKEYLKHKRKKKKEAAELQSLRFNPAEQQIIEKVRDAAEALDVDIFLVGGFIRDRLSGKDKEKEEAGDLDFMCEHDAAKIVQYLAKKHGYTEPVEYSRSKAIMLNMDEHPVDFIDAKHIFHPLEVEGYSTLEEEEDETIAIDDAYRRDFTINSLMYDIRKNELLDPTGKGLQDLKEGVINTIIDPFVKFRIHAPDMLRALRFAATLGLKLGPNMLEAMRANADRVKPRDQGGDISNRRVRKELRKAIDTPEHWATMRKLLQEAGLDIVLAEDIQDVQEDFEGGIEYKFDEKSKEEKAMLKRFTKQSGIFDIFKGKPSSGITPGSKDEQTLYLARKIDEQLAKMPAKQHQQFVSDTLAQYKIGRTDPRYAEILSLLKNYKRGLTITPSSSPAGEIKWKGSMKGFCKRAQDFGFGYGNTGQTNFSVPNSEGAPGPGFGQLDPSNPSTPNSSYTDFAKLRLKKRQEQTEEEKRREKRKEVVNKLAAKPGQFLEADPESKKPGETLLDIKKKVDTMNRATRSTEKEHEIAPEWSSKEQTTQEEAIGQPGVVPAPVGPGVRAPKPQVEAPKEMSDISKTMDDVRKKMKSTTDEGVKEVKTLGDETKKMKDNVDTLNTSIKQMLG